MLGDGHGAFVTSRTYALPAARSFVAGDFNGDHHVDCRLAGLLGQLPGSGARRRRWHLRHGVLLPDRDRYATSLAAGDMDGDGDLDVAVTKSEKQTVGVFLSTGHGDFAPRFELPTDVNPCSVVVPDLDRDGDLDLAVLCDDGARVDVYPGNGDGSFGDVAVARRAARTLRRWSRERSRTETPSWRLPCLRTTPSWC